MLFFFFNCNIHSHCLGKIKVLFEFHILSIELSKVFNQGQIVKSFSLCCFPFKTFNNCCVLFKEFNMRVSDFLIELLVLNFPHSCFVCFRPCGWLFFYSRDLEWKPEQQVCELNMVSFFVFSIVTLSNINFSKGLVSKYTYYILYFKDLKLDIFLHSFEFLFVVPFILWQEVKQSREIVLFAKPFQSILRTAPCLKLLTFSCASLIWQVNAGMFFLQAGSVCFIYNIIARLNIRTRRQAVRGAFDSILFDCHCVLVWVFVCIVHKAFLYFCL